MDIDQSQKTFQLNVILEFLAKMMDEFGMKKFISVISYIPEDTLMQSKREEMAQKEAKKAE